MCRVLRVSRSGFYAWQSRPESIRSQQRRELVTEIKQITKDRSMSCYGSPRIYRELVKRGRRCSKNTVAKLMKNHGLAAKCRRKFVVTTDSAHALPTAKNLLNREFVQGSPNQIWLADITYVSTEEGWLYLAAVLDTHSRRIVGWSMSEHMQANLVADALQMAIGRRCRDQASNLMHHSDRGSQYASQAYQDVLREHNITCSMSRKGNCWDNAMMESFFATLKKERVHREVYRTRDSARQSIFEYIEMFYNRHRQHSALGYLSPMQYEEKYEGRLRKKHERSAHKNSACEQTRCGDRKQAQKRRLALAATLCP